MPATMMDSRREAARHFTQYLCAVNKLSSRQPSLTREELKKVFTEEYQPQYNVQCLELKNLLHTLAMAGFLEKPSSNENPLVIFKWNRVEATSVSNGHLPDKPPSRLTKPKPRLIVSQRYTQTRENKTRPDGISDEKCDLCKVILSPDTVDEHRQSEMHSLRLSYRRSRKNFDDTKHLLEIQMRDEDSDETPSVGDSLKKSCRVGIKYDMKILITNKSDDKEILIEKVIQLMPNKDIKLANLEAVSVCAGKQKTIGIQVQFSARGAILFPLIFKILPLGSLQPKYFLKEIYFLTQSELMDQLAPSEPFRPSMGPVVKVQNAPIIPGTPAEFTQTSELRRTLPVGKNNFEIPPALLRFLNSGFKELENMSPADKVNLATVRSMLPQGDAREALTPHNYSQLLELLLFIEEHQMSRDIHYYDMHSAVLKKNSLGLWLEVPGLVDKRPSLLINDTLIISFAEDRSIAYEGYVHQIQGSSVLLGFHNSFVKKYSNQKLEIQFKINRGVLKSMHLALYIINVNKAQFLLFPTMETKPQRQPPLRPWFNKAIEKNPEQQAAVRNVCHNSSQNSPYLIFGPPGTGKTVTLVETILQLWKPPSKITRILVCTPSNSAADEITSRVLRVIYDYNIVPASKVKEHIFRMCAMSRSWNLVPPTIQSAEITNHDPRDGRIYFPRKEVIMSYDIVICTFSCASRLVLSQFPSDHFTHIIMDEVGQALEPEALIPLAGLATKCGADSFTCQIVMAGDPKQLGPILQSPLAAKFGLDKSMLERLMSLPLYSKRPGTNRYDANVLTKLVLNYRSHPSILAVSNNLFYDGELKPIGDSNVIEAACNWQGLEKKNFPLIFHGVEGVDEREGSSPSFFNRQEIEVVTNYIQKILADRLATSKEIGVVTPYNMQVKKIKKAFNLLKLQDIDVASVEQFQGQERKVIIISTVRSRPEFLQFDYMFQLGFLQNPKRFNVAVTRARALLIVVGNPNVLQHDRCWRTLLEHCIANGAYKGPPFEFTSQESEDNSQRMLCSNFDSLKV